MRVQYRSLMALFVMSTSAGCGTASSSEQVSDVDSVTESALTPAGSTLVGSKLLCSYIDLSTNSGELLTNSEYTFLQLTDGRGLLQINVEVPATRQPKSQRIVFSEFSRKSNEISAFPYGTYKLTGGVRYERSFTQLAYSNGGPGRYVTSIESCTLAKL